MNCLLQLPEELQFLVLDFFTIKDYVHVSETCQSGAFLVQQFRQGSTDLDQCVTVIELFHALGHILPHFVATLDMPLLYEWYVGQCQSRAESLTDAVANLLPFWWQGTFLIGNTVMACVPQRGCKFFHYTYGYQFPTMFWHAALSFGFDDWNWWQYVWQHMIPSRPAQCALVHYLDHFVEESQRLHLRQCCFPVDLSLDDAITSMIQQGSLSGCQQYLATLQPPVSTTTNLQNWLRQAVIHQQPEIFVLLTQHIPQWHRDWKELCRLACMAPCCNILVHLASCQLFASAVDVQQYAVVQYLLTEHTELTHDHYSALLMYAIQKQDATVCQMLLSTTGFNNVYTMDHVSELLRSCPHTLDVWHVFWFSRGILQCPVVKEFVWQECIVQQLTTLISWLWRFNFHWQGFPALQQLMINPLTNQATQSFSLLIRLNQNHLRSADWVQLREWASHDPNHLVLVAEIDSLFHQWAMTKSLEK